MSTTANIGLAKKLNIFAVIISIAVLGLVGVMRIPHFKIDLGIDFSFLPPIHATFNCGVAIALVAALYFVKQKNIEAHKKAIYIAFGLSVLFLVSYVLYHFTTPETVFGDLNGDRKVDANELLEVGNMRSIYLSILFSHIVLAAVIFPFTLFTFIRAYTGQISKHRKMAKWVFPIWLYVAVTGPICYFMLRPYYL